MNGWRRRLPIAIALIALFFIIQVSVPISRLGGDGTAERFGWQMFSHEVPAPVIEIETGSGVTSASLDDFMARVRADIDIRALLPPHLCEVVDGAEAVYVDGERIRC